MDPQAEVNDVVEQEQPQPAVSTEETEAQTLAAETVEPNDALDCLTDGPSTLRPENPEQELETDAPKEIQPSTVTVDPPDAPGYLGIGFAVGEPYSTTLQQMADDQGISPSDVVRDMIVNTLQNYFGVARSRGN